MTTERARIAGRDSMNRSRAEDRPTSSPAAADAAANGAARVAHRTARAATPPPIADRESNEPPAADAPLPYGPFLQATLPAISRVFRVLNRVYVLPAIKAGLGPLHANPVTGSWMLLRTTGRRTGRRREVALGYVLLDGAVYCSAGFGERTAWYRNLLAEPAVEIVLPAGGFAGRAEPVTDPDELERGWRALIRALGVLGRVFVCPADAPSAVIAERTANLPLVRIRATGLAAGPADPGGASWIVPTALLVAIAGWWIGRRAAARRRPVVRTGAPRCH